MDTDKEKAVDFCKFISQTNRKLFENRKKHEWRIFLSIITFYSLTILYKLTNNDFKLDESLFCSCLLFILFYSFHQFYFLALCTEQTT